jgi:tRNA pseudouridine38-40 synthase
MNKFKIVLSYDGTRFGGWQVQPNSISIQALVEEALSVVLKTKTPLVGSGRTDAGVHALAQTAHFSTSNSFDLCKLQHSLNGILPDDIRVCCIEPVPDHFHARYSASSKIYRYHLRLSKNVDPFKRSYHLPVHFPLSLPLLKEAATYFIGTHDFTSFANQGDQGAAAHNPIRTITRLDIVDEEGGIYLEFEGNGFLYKMVRNITGTLLDICRGKIELSRLPEIFAAKDRSKAPPAAPPHALFLAKVNYNISAIEQDKQDQIKIDKMILSCAS